MIKEERGKLNMAGTLSTSINAGPVNEGLIVDKKSSLLSFLENEQTTSNSSAK